MTTSKTSANIQPYDDILDSVTISYERIEWLGFILSTVIDSLKYVAKRDIAAETALKKAQMAAYLIDDFLNSLEKDIDILRAQEKDD